MTPLHKFHKTELLKDEIAFTKLLCSAFASHQRHFPPSVRFLAHCNPCPAIGTGAHHTNTSFTNGFWLNAHDFFCRSNDFFFLHRHCLLLSRTSGQKLDAPSFVVSKLTLQGFDEGNGMRWARRRKPSLNLPNRALKR